MSEPQANEVRYPLHYVLGVLDDAGEVYSALDALLEAFLDTEIKVFCGAREAERISAGTGRTGLLNKVLQIAESLGVANHELEVKHRYEQALRDGRFVVHVLAPTEDRKQLAAQLLKESGAHFINYFGGLVLVEMAPWDSRA